MGEKAKLVQWGLAGAIIRGSEKERRVEGQHAGNR